MPPFFLRERTMNLSSPTKDYGATVREGEQRSAAMESHVLPLGVAFSPDVVAYCLAWGVPELRKPKACGKHWHGRLRRTCRKPRDCSTVAVSVSDHGQQCLTDAEANRQRLFVNAIKPDRVPAIQSSNLKGLTYDRCTN